MLDSLGPLGVDRHDFLFCATHLVTVIAAHDSGAISFVDGDCTRAALGGVEVVVPSRRRCRGGGEVELLVAGSTSLSRSD